MSRVGRNGAKLDATGLWIGIGALLGLSVAAAPAAESLQWSADLTAGVEHTSNLLRTETAPEAATFATAGVNLTLLEQTRTLYADLNTVDIWRDFPAGTPGGDFTPALDAFLLWTAVPDVFSWRVNENLGLIAPFSNGALAEPDRERVNVASTGPNLQLPWGRSNWITASARYSRVNFQRSTEDNGYRIAGQAGIGHELAIGGVLSLNAAEARSVAETSGVHYEVGTAYVNYLQASARSTIDASLGVSRVTAGNTPTDVYADLRVSRHLTPHTAVIVDFVHRYADLAEVFTRQQDLDLNIGSIEIAQATDQVIRETSVAVSLTWTGRRTDVIVSGYQFYDKQFNAGPLGLSQRGASLYGELGFKLRPNLTFGVDAYFERLSNGQLSGARDSAIRGHLTWQATSRLGLAVGAEAYAQSSAPLTYRETRYYASVTWRLTRGQLTRQRPEFDSAARRRMQYGR
jgi:hypothetical protein